MPMFAYTARDMSGKQVTGTVEANAERDVAALLSEKSLFPVEVKAGYWCTAGNFRAKASQASSNGDVLLAIGSTAARRRTNDPLTHCDGRSNKQRNS